VVYFLADADLLGFRRSLTILVKGHNNHGRDADAAVEPGVPLLGVWAA